MSDLSERAPAANRVNKSPEAFRTISEVAAELDVPPHVLRFWEGKFSQIRPLKRGGRRRYYRPEDVDLLRRIRSLLYTDGYTIKGVQKVLRERGLKGLTAETRRGGDEAGPAAGGLGADQRATLEAVLTELLELRDMLKSTSG